MIIPGFARIHLRSRWFICLLSELDYSTPFAWTPFGFVKIHRNLQINNYIRYSYDSYSSRRVHPIIRSWASPSVACDLVFLAWPTICRNICCLHPPSTSVTLTWSEAYLPQSLEVFLLWLLPENIAFSSTGIIQNDGTFRANFFSQNREANLDAFKLVLSCKSPKVCSCTETWRICC